MTGMPEVSLRRRHLSGGPKDKKNIYKGQRVLQVGKTPTIRRRNKLNV